MGSTPLHENYEGVSLPEDVREQAVEIGAAIRRCEVAPLVGAGLSIACKLPSWDKLVDKMIYGWKAEISRDDPAVAPLKPDEYRDMLYAVFGRDKLMIVSYLRAVSLNRDGLSAYERLVSRALYASLPSDHPLSSDSNFLPPERLSPSDAHLHLVALFADRSPNRIWTTNYDELLEKAAGELGVECVTHDLKKRRGAGDKLQIAHLHGTLPAPETGREWEGAWSGNRSDGNSDASIILAEDDYHAATANNATWSNREFYRLFDEYSVLIFGMSLADPNLRRILFTIPEESLGKEPRHFAIMPSFEKSEVAPSRQRMSRELEQALGTSWFGRDPGFLKKAARKLYPRLGRPDPTKDEAYAESVCEVAARAFRDRYWEPRRVKILETDKHSHVLSFLMRLRFESFGDARGDLWREGARKVENFFELWKPNLPKSARTLLEKEAEILEGAARKILEEERLKKEKTAPPRNKPSQLDASDEIEDVGIFLLKKSPDGENVTLKLAFRKNGKKRVGREFSVDPDEPTGVAGHVFVSGVPMLTRRGGGVYEGVSKEPERAPSKPYQGVFAVPLIRWKNPENGTLGIPMGVAYITTVGVEGPFFELLRTNEKTQEKMYTEMRDGALRILKKLASEAVGGLSPHAP